MATTNRDVQDHMDRLPKNLSQDIQSTLKSYLESNLYSGDGSKRDSHKVDSSLCQLIKDMYDDGVSAQDIVDHLPISSPNTVYYHVRDECSHKHRSRVTYDECGWIRVKARSGDSVKELSQDYDLSTKSVRLHAKGECSHEDGIDPVDPDVLYQNNFSGYTMTTSVCEECDEEFEHEACRDRVCCSVKCKNIRAGKLSHASTADD